MHGLTSPSPWCTLDGRNAATVERSVLATASRWRAGLRGGGGRALGAADGDGLAAVVTVEGLRVGSAMPCTQGAMGNAVAPNQWLSRPPPGWRAGLRGGGGRALGADGDGVAPVGLVEALRVGHAPPYTATVWRNAAMAECSRSPPPAADEHARPVESVEGRQAAMALRRSRQETLSEARTRSVTARMRKGRLSLSLSLPPLPPPPPPSPWVLFLSSLIGKNPPTPFLLFTFLLSYFLLP